MCPDKGPINQWVRVPPGQAVLCALLIEVGSRLAHTQASASGRQFEARRCKRI